MENLNFTLYRHDFPNGKYYVGITGQSPERRWQNGYGYRDNKYLFRAIEKYGWDNIKHVILYSNLSKEDACIAEKKCIKKWKTSDRRFGYNISNGGELAHLGCKADDALRKKLSEAHKGHTYTMTDDHKRKISEAIKGRQFSEEHRKKLVEAKKNISNETRSKMRAAKAPKKVLCKETGIIYESSYHAQHLTNISASSIRRSANSYGRRSAGGFHWLNIEQQVNTEVTKNLKDS